MGTVTVLPHGRALTRRDLERMPDDGHRYELIDGTLVVTPAPSPQHQSVLGGLYSSLAAQCPPDLQVLSPSTRRLDLTLKRARLESAGCPSYWVVDPDGPRSPSGSCGTAGTSSRPPSWARSPSSSTGPIR